MTDTPSRLRFTILLIGLLCSGFQPLAAAPTPRVITLAPPEGLPANGQVPFTVVGNALENVGLRVWSLKSANSALTPQNLVFSGQKAAQNGQTTFYAPLKTAGLYLAEARAGMATSSELFRLVPFVVAVKTLSLSAPGTMQPSSAVPFTVSASNWRLQTARLQIWKIGEGNSQTAAWQGIAQRKKVKKDEDDPNSIEFRVPLRTPGLYLAQAHAGNLQSLAYVRISDMGLAVKRAPREVLVYAVRLSSGLPIAGASARLDDAGVRGTDAKGREIWLRKPGPPRAVKAGSDGVARFYNVPDSGDMKVVATSADGSLQEVAAPLAQSDDSGHKLLFYTERPIYRPGQKVFFKGIAREDLALRGMRAGDSLYKPLVSRRVAVEITDAANRKIETLELKTNGMGTFAGSLQLPDEAAVGRYSVETKLFEADGKTSSPFYNRFAVQEYRKPEYEVILTPLLKPGKTWATQGEAFDVLVQARYFFGGAVRGAKIVFSGDESGETTLDARGEHKIHVLNREDSSRSDQTRTLRVQVTDAANRIVEATTQISAPWSEVNPALKFDRAVYDLQNTARLEATLRDPAGRPITGEARVRLFYYRSKTVKDRETLALRTINEEIEFFNEGVQTDARGRASISVRLGKWGYIRARLSASDRLGREKVGEATTWVIKPGERNYYGFDFPALDLLADKTDVAPGETVKALFLTAEPGAWALVTLQSDRIFFHRVLHLTSQATPFSFVMPAAASPGAHLTVGFARGGEWDAQSVYLRSLSPAQQLKIAIAPEKLKYRPGETALYRLKATDGTGKPRSAEISLGLVDKAIYSLAADETPDPQDFFYAQRADRVATQWSQPEELNGGSYQRIDKPVTVRSRFEDTAYWNPFVQTDAAGVAQLSIPLPDNLTTWRATARGVTFDTSIGASTAELLVTKPLLVRLITPRFWTQHDRVRVQVIVQNNTSVKQDLRVSLRGENAGIGAVGAETQGAQSGSVPANGSASFYWDVEAPSVPPTGQMSLTSTARGEGTGITFDDSTDAMKLNFPVKAHGVRVQKIGGGALSGTAKNATLDLSVPGAIENASRLEVTLSPSLAGPMLAALPNLAQYPYGCTEQTLSRFVPAVVAAKTLRDLQQPLPASMKELPKQVAAGLKILYAFQHDDGGWGWWREDDSDPSMTGAVLYGLALTHEAGYAVERERIVLGLRAVQTLFQQSDRPDRATPISPDIRAWMMLGYASAVRAFKVNIAKELGTKDDYIGAVVGVQDKLSNYGLAALALAATKISHPQAGALLTKLETRAKRETLSSGEGVWWQNETGDGGWSDSDIETTALALQAEIAARPNSPLILPGLRWLMLQREGATWRSTKDTSQAVLALAAYLRTAGELAPNATITLRVNGQVARVLRFTKANIGSEDPLVRLEHLSAGAKIDIERNGAGAVYYSAKMTAYTPEKLDASTQNGLRLERIYSIRDAAGVWQPISGPLPDGALVRVDLRVTTSKAYQYLLLEDPIPSGFEFRPEDDALAQKIAYEVDPTCDCRRIQIDPPVGWEPLPVTRRENRDDRAAFFMSLLPGKRRDADAPRQFYLRYILRPEQAGTRVALPARIEAMYRPNINARSAQTSVAVAAESAP